MLVIATATEIAIIFISVIVLVLVGTQHSVIIMPNSQIGLGHVLSSQSIDVNISNRKVKVN